MGPIHAQKAYIVVSGHDLQFCFAQKQERLESRVECKMTSSDKKKEELPQIQFLFFFFGPVSWPSLRGQSISGWRKRRKILSICDPNAKLNMQVLRFDFSARNSTVFCVKCRVQCRIPNAILVQKRCVHGDQSYVSIHRICCAASLPFSCFGFAKGSQIKVISHEEARSVSIL